MIRVKKKKKKGKFFVLLTNFSMMRFARTKARLFLTVDRGESLLLIEILEVP